MCSTVVIPSENPEYASDEYNPQIVSNSWRNVNLSWMFF